MILVIYMCLALYVYFMSFKTTLHFMQCLSVVVCEGMFTCGLADVELCAR